MPKGLAPTAFESQRSQFMVGAPREIRSSPAGITAQILEIALVEARGGVAGGFRNEGLAGKTYLEALRRSREEVLGKHVAL